MQCRFCGQDAKHELDGEWYCCEHFDELVAHCGNVKALDIGMIARAARAKMLLELGAKKDKANREIGIPEAE